jgi:hypothetical protein
MVIMANDTSSVHMKVRWHAPNDRQKQTAPPRVTPAAAAPRQLYSISRHRNAPRRQHPSGCAMSGSVRTLLRGAQPGAGAAKAPPRHHARAEPRGVRLEAAVPGRHAGELQEAGRSSSYRSSAAGMGRRS